MKTLILIPTFMLSFVSLSAFAANTAAPQILTRMHVDTAACFNDSGFDGSHLNSEIATQAGRGLTLTEVRFVGNDQCEYVYTRKGAPAAKTVQLDPDAKYIDMQTVGCNDDFGSDSSETLMNFISKAFQDEANQGFHQVSSTHSRAWPSTWAGPGLCVNLFVRNLKI